MWDDWADMPDEKDRDIIIMALMYLKNDYTPEDLEALGLAGPSTREMHFEAKIQELIEDFVGPTWDEEATDENIKMETKKRTRHKS